MATTNIKKWEEKAARKIKAPTGDSGTQDLENVMDTLDEIFINMIKPSCQEILTSHNILTEEIVTTIH